MVECHEALKYQELVPLLHVTNTLVVSKAVLKSLCQQCTQVQHLGLCFGCVLGNVPADIPCIFTICQQLDVMIAVNIHEEIGVIVIDKPI